MGIAGAWVNCPSITFYCADDNFVNGLVEEKSRMGKIKCESDYLVHVRKRQLSLRKEFQGNNSIK